jgi:hypothetical protein
VKYAGWEASQRLQKENKIKWREKIGYSHAKPLAHLLWLRGMVTRVTAPQELQKGGISEKRLVQKHKPDVGTDKYDKQRGASRRKMQR